MEPNIIIAPGNVLRTYYRNFTRAGATTGLILYSFITLFPFILAVIFVMAVVAPSTTGDTYTGVLLGIPGANSAPATMIDGFAFSVTRQGNICN